MSFDVFVLRFRHGQPIAAEREPVRVVLESVPHRDVLGAWVIETADGGHTEMFARGLYSREDFTGCFFPLRGYAPQVLEFIVRVARAGDMAIIPAMEPNRFILTLPEQQEHLPTAKGWADPALCQSGHELQLLIADGYDAWRRYRDSVLGRGRSVERGERDKRRADA